MFDTLIVFLKELLEKFNFKKSQQMITKREKYPACKELIIQNKTSLDINGG